jgi:zinc protease
VWGDFETAEMERRLRRIFAGWPRGTPARPAQIPIPDPRPGYYLIEKDDLTQSRIQMAGLGLRRDTPDFYAVEVMNQILGGGFGSRLMTNVRAKQGLAYHVWGRLGMTYDYPGMLTVGMGTKSDATVHGIKALLAEVDGMIQGPIGSDELARAKDGLLNSFIFRIDSKDKVLHEKVSDYFHGYPLDRLERYMGGVRAVTVADVERVARKYLHKDKLAILVVGKSSDFGQPLSSLGPVTKIDIAIPMPGSANPEEP